MACPCRGMELQKSQNKSKHGKAGSKVLNLNIPRRKRNITPNSSIPNTNKHFQFDVVQLTMRVTCRYRTLIQSPWELVYADSQESAGFCKCFVNIVKMINDVLMETSYKLERNEILPSAEG